MWRHFAELERCGRDSPGPEGLIPIQGEFGPKKVPRPARVHDRVRPFPGF